MRYAFTSFHFHYSEGKTVVLFNKEAVSS
jgi:hypothetical protein